MIAKSEDGHGGQVFFETFRDEPEEDKLLDRFLHTPPRIQFLTSGSPRFLPVF